MVAAHSQLEDELLQLTLQIRNRADVDANCAKYHGDALIADKVNPVVDFMGDITSIIKSGNLGTVGSVISDLVTGKGLNAEKAAQAAACLSDYSGLRQKFIDSQVKAKYDAMLHPPLSYLGDQFMYRSADGKFNSAMNPHLGQAGAPYAKTVPSKAAPLGALPDPGDVFDKLMARAPGGRDSTSGLSSMLVYHATIIIHDIFRTNDGDKNISDSSSYLDLSPLYGYTKEMVSKVRDTKYKLGLLKPDTFAEDRLLRQPPGVCVILVMYNRYHNYVAKMLRKINENGRFSKPAKYDGIQLIALAKNFYPEKGPVSMRKFDAAFNKACKTYDEAWRAYQAALTIAEAANAKEEAAKAKAERDRKAAEAAAKKAKSSNGTNGHHHHEDEKPPAAPAAQSGEAAIPKAAKTSASPLPKLGVKEFDESDVATDFREAEQALLDYLDEWDVHQDERVEFESGYDAAWTKLDDDLFNTARLITCGMYIQVSIHDYLRALMGFHAHKTNFTLDPRADFDQKKTTRGAGNQVTVEFNLLYRFHCAISRRDEDYTVEYMKKEMGMKDPSNAGLHEFMGAMGKVRAEAAAKIASGEPATEPWDVTFGIPGTKRHFKRNEVTGLFDDAQMTEALTSAMDDPISNFGPRNVPKCLKAVEMLGIQQARKWEVGTLNDFRAFFGMPVHKTFEDITRNIDVQNALRDLYEHPDKVELYPGVFCESDSNLDCDPGPRSGNNGLALWVAIFSDAITLVRSDRFYTVDWNTNSLTAWGMAEVTPDNDVLKSSVFHRLVQRAFPGWFHYDSVRFFHPFYTSEANAKFAKQQGFSSEFGLATPKRDTHGNMKLDKSNWDASKPKKPNYIDDFEDIASVLDNQEGKFEHPAMMDPRNVPSAVYEVLHSKKAHKHSECDDLTDVVKKTEPALQDYLQNLMQVIIKREAISMTASTFQIDITRDFAIPVVTTFVADFLGFGHMVQNQSNAKGRFSENEIYKHITNCQNFLAYNADETKLLRRRKAFKESMGHLVTLTRRGVVARANQWSFTTACFGKKLNAMEELGVTIAKRVIEYESDAERAAAIMLLVCLDLAYSSVNSFTAVINSYMDGLYKRANIKAGELGFEPEWIHIQKLAFEEDNDHLKELEDSILRIAHSTVSLPIIRKANDTATLNEKKKTYVSKGEVIILDVHRAVQQALLAGKTTNKTSDKTNNKTADKTTKLDYLSLQSSFAQGLGDFYPRHFSALALTSMVQFVARMRNARRGHDAQGKLKKVKMESSAEGYENFMAPMRVARIAAEVKHLPDSTIFNSKVLRPECEIYLSPTWDEALPFPTTWKIRFDGFDKSSYGPEGDEYAMLRQGPTYDEFPPFYQPRGPSHTGGTFNDAAVSVAGTAAPAAPSAPAAATVGDKHRHTKHKRKHNPGHLGGCKMPSRHL